MNPLRLLTRAVQCDELTPTPQCDELTRAVQCDELARAVQGDGLTRAVESGLRVTEPDRRTTEPRPLGSGALPKLAFMFGLTVLLIAASFGQTAAVPPPRKVLFVGDSFTYFQNGIYTHFEKLAAASKPPLAVTADKSVAGGAFLHRLWDLKDPLKAIQTGPYDVVVLQEDIPETTVADFREYASKFVAEVRKTHARPILFMAWAYPRLGWISMAEIAKAHRDAAKELNVDVAPVGLAWQQASKMRPSMNFYGPDREHPSIYGTYLATCVIYATIYSNDPSGFTYAPSGVSPEEALFLQRVAWQTVQDYRAGRL